MDHDRAISQMKASGRTDAPAIAALTEALVVALAASGKTRHHDSALAALAEQHFSSASWMGWTDVTPAEQVAQTWKAAQQWKTLDDARFGDTAQMFTERIRRRFGDDVAEQIEAFGPDGLGPAAALIERVVRGEDSPSARESVPA